MKVVLITTKAIPDLFPAADRVVIRAVEELEQQPSADLYIDLDFTAEEARLSGLSRMLPSLVMVNAVAATIAEIGYPFIRINGWPGMLERGIHELVVPDPEVAVRVEEIYDKLGWAYRVTPDIPGMITARVLAALINEAWYTWQEGVSSKEEIDTAMKLGTNYPLGPFEWGERIGLDQVVGLLKVMSRTDTRYIPADSLENASNKIKI
ncbi:MAG TPA: 3-hydroxyacyl-CoA dehydrogenase family protein [Puia sp.]|jgi:3-hydroxybutyryl-CoA dehydrogenase|nr:3-hydroxyacyl-CoA dehydrogenase family protein [Puia sp.]